jgi:hypothetical protein
LLSLSCFGLFLSLSCSPFAASPSSSPQNPHQIPSPYNGLLFFFFFVLDFAALVSLHPAATAAAAL